MNTWDEAKRQTTLAERRLDFAEAELIFAGKYFSRRDDRRDYGESRFITVGWLSRRFVVLVWTPCDDGRRINSMRHGHDWEKALFQSYLD